MSSYTPWHLFLLTHTLALHPDITHLTLSRISLAWWFRLHPVPQLQVLILHSCELDETGIGLVAQAFQGLLGIVLRGSEVRCGGWDMESIRRGSAATISNRNVSPASTLEAVENELNGPGSVAKGWWSTKHAYNADPSVSVFKSLRVVRFEMCAASCAVDAVRMVLDRCPTVERVEFVGCGVEEQLFLEGVAGGVVEWEGVGPDRTGCEARNQGQGTLWWEGQKRFKEKIENRISMTQVHLQSTKQEIGEVNQDEETTQDNQSSSLAGCRKCIVIQGDVLNGLRDKWYQHVKSRQNFWGHI
ncbi:hypothetical protein BDR26DRAFT_428865 [Obelidium mucronatum]|nr:hypothetical protein BDR26DRAFT_428865 [Obelidium mucronatum]